ncbi:hypothetical protein HNY73_008938 [Argiope bruennichi]|uniref:Endonuclease/exonuclease/phosphatase domain-containing protein n=1 Tax=Argiope bruennichi TaxID=94029 RepID=A0A8T0FEH5_ARGBR|nr:hypothetical protein HNY73_008938 [Argiope bruennichi]
MLSEKTAAGGGGLVFLVRNVHFKNIPDAVGSSGVMEYQGLKSLSKDRNIDIIITYYLPNNLGLPVDLMEGFLENNTLVLGDLNAKHAEWGSHTTNNRRTELVNLANDKAFLFLNDGSHTYHSHSYNSADALNISMISPGLFPYSSWRALDGVGSEHLPLIEIDFKVNYYGDSKLRWKFRRADSEDVRKFGSTDFSFRRSWRKSGLVFIIFSAAKASIPRGKYKGKKQIYK